MNYKRRVKPSKRAIEEARKKRKPLIISGAIVFSLVVMLVGFHVVSYRVPVSGKVDYDIVKEANRAFTEDNVSYSGIWYEDEENNFEIYLPSHSVLELKRNGYSFFVVDSNSTPYAGLTYLDEYANSVSSIFVRVAEDTGLSISLDISDITVKEKDGISWVDGLLKSGNSKFTDLQVYGFVNLRKECPIFVWSFANSESNSNLGDLMQECYGTYRSIQSSSK